MDEPTTSPQRASIAPLLIVCDVTRAIASDRDRLRLRGFARRDVDGYVLFFGRPAA